MSKLGVIAHLNAEEVDQKQHNKAIEVHLVLKALPPLTLKCDKLFRTSFFLLLDKN